MVVANSLLIIVSKDPYSFEETNLALSIALMSKEENVDTTIFLIEDGVYVARKGQRAVGRTNISEKLEKLINNGINVLAEDLSLKSRGMASHEQDHGDHSHVTYYEKIIDGIKISNIDELIDLVMEKSDRAIWF